MSLSLSDFDRLADERFAAYCKAAELAQASRSMADATVAGRAWADFVDVFPEARRPMTVANRRPVLVHSR